MLDYFRDIDPYIEQILDMGFSPLEDEENSYLDDGASKVIFKSLSNAVGLSISPYRNGHDVGTVETRVPRAGLPGPITSPENFTKDQALQA